MGVMKRGILKSGAFAVAALTCLLVACWAVSLPNDPKSAQLAFGNDRSPACLALGKGDLILCDHFDNREVIRLLVAHRPFQPGIAEDIGTDLPGFTFRHITLTSGQRIWSLELSLLIPAIFMLLFSGLLFGMLWMRPGMARNIDPPNESMQGTAVLCLGLHG